MATEQKEDPHTLQKEEEEKDFNLGSDESEAPFPLGVPSRVLYMLGTLRQVRRIASRNGWNWFVSVAARTGPPDSHTGLREPILCP
ncbi:unnamed protein product [Ilex paraguariensis]|uniref:Uncharacterized protein n=1 Tax=Ilex paraguariensis TaxID=185542 RepID=A0ABC8URJ9_9AQUA